MSNSIVSTVYRHVIDDVINQVRGDFEEMGIDDNVLNELQRSWETKVARSRVANFMVNEEGYYEGDSSPHAGIITETNQLQYPPVTIHESLSTAAAAASLATMASGSATARRDLNESDLHRNSGFANSHDLGGMHPHPHNMANGEFAVPNMNLSTPPLSMNRNLQTANNGRPNIPQHDGANDELTTGEIDVRLETYILEKHAENMDDGTSSIDITAFNRIGTLVPVDSLPEEYRQLINAAKQRAVAAGALDPSYLIPQLDGDDDEQPDEDEINSDLDDSDEDDDDGEGAEDLEHIILCLYDKVTRTKNKWKCVLKDGIMLVNGRDYLFHRANGDFEW